MVHCQNALGEAPASRRVPLKSEMGKEGLRGSAPISSANGSAWGQGESTSALPLTNPQAQKIYEQAPWWVYGAEIAAVVAQGFACPHSEEPQREGKGYPEYSAAALRSSEVVAGSIWMSPFPSLRHCLRGLPLPEDRYCEHAHFYLDWRSPAR